MIKETIMSRSLRLMFSGGLVLGVSLMAHNAMAADAMSNASTAADTAPTQRVEITGTLIKRVADEGALPVQTITREDIQKLGVTSAEDLVKTLSASSAVNGYFTGQNAGLQTFSLASASLRGIGANKTLVLLNGKRLANYATDGMTVDINSIPLGAIDHVDVLKDGASAIYGSDAIAGVINFITRRNFTGVEVTGQTGGSMAGGGASTTAGITWGFGDLEKDRYNFMISADLAKDTPIYGRQRSYANHSSDEVNGLFDQSATPSGALRTFDPLGGPTNALNSQGDGIGNPLAPDNCAQNGSYFDQAYGTCRFNSSPYVPLTPDVSRQNVSANFRLKLDDKTEFYMDTFFARKLAKVHVQPSPYSVAFLATDKAFATKNIYPAIILSHTSPFYPTTFLNDYFTANGLALNQDVTVSYRAFDAGERLNVDTANQFHVVAGFRGAFMKKYDYDISYVHNSSTVSEDTLNGYQNQTALVALLSNNNAFNPFTQFQTPALAAQIAATNFNGRMMSATLYTDSLEGTISGDLFKMPGGTASFAVGGLVRNETFQYNPSAAFQSGDVSGYGGNALPLDKARHTFSVYGEVDMPIIKNLDADLAVRTDSYPAITTTNPKVSLRYQPMSELLFRTSYGHGFREPSLPEFFTPVTEGTTGSINDPVTGNQGQFTQSLGGSATLSPEKSKQWSFGVVADVTKDISVAVDYWNIRITNLVTSINPQLVLNRAAQGNPYYVPLVTRDGLNNITNINGINTNANGVSTSGVDVDLTWRIAKTENYGSFSTHVNGTLTAKYDTTLSDGTTQKSVAKTVDENADPLNAVANGGILFRWRHQLSLDWSKGPYSASLIQNFQTGYDDNWPVMSGFSSQAFPWHVGSLTTWDLQASYTGIKNLMLRVGVKNLMDKQPPATVGLGNYFQTGYDPSYYDAHGRSVYVVGKYNF